MLKSGSDLQYLKQSEPGFWLRFSISETVRTWNLEYIFFNQVKILTTSLYILLAAKFGLVWHFCLDQWKVIFS